MSTSVVMREPRTTLVLMLVGAALSFPVRSFIEDRIAAFVDTRGGLWRAGASAAYAGVLFALFVLALTFVAAETYNPFLYFRF
jgi:hypothetical protein